jgi:hypothetical protein
MNSASQSQPDVETARQMLQDSEELTRSGWRMASPAWFPLILVSMTVLASVPVALLLDRPNGAAVYWVVAGPLAAIASGWFFATLPAQPPTGAGMVVLATGAALLAGTLWLAFFGPQGWSVSAPWIVVGIAFGIFAAAWRSVPTGAFAVVSLLAGIGFALAPVPRADIILAVVIGLAAGTAALVDLVQALGRRS